MQLQERPVLEHVGVGSAVRVWHNLASAELYEMAGTDGFVEQQPVGRLLDPEEIAAALAWLAGPDSGAMTGAVMVVDGGLSV